MEYRRRILPWILVALGAMMVLWAAVMLRQLDLNLVIDDTTEEYSDDISAGYVIRSSPAEGETLQDGDVVNFRFNV